MLYKITNGSVSYGADTVLERIDFQIKDREKIAVVGRNGCGKTTLLKAITGEVSLEEGTGEQPFSVVKADSPSIGYLKQIAFEDENLSLIEEIRKVFRPLIQTEEKIARLTEQLAVCPDDGKIKSYSALCEKYEIDGGYTYKKEYSVMIKKFGFSEADKSKPLGAFSGGERTKIAFIKLLLSKPDILLLDEPTNHLDVENIEWLEDYLKNYKSAVVIVSHDRMFLNKIVGKVYEIEYGETTVYHGNYSDFERQKRENHIRRQKDHDIWRAEVDRLTRLIERFRYKATKAKMVQSKIKQLERMKRADAPDRYDLKPFKAHFTPALESANKVLSVNRLNVGFDRPLVEITLEVLKGDKLAVIGPNGAGKSTFLKTLMGIIPPISGEFMLGVNVKIGYFDQQMAHYVSEKSVLEDLEDAFPAYDITAARSALGAFLFSGEDVFKKVSDLSGGERVRLALLKIFGKKPNLLILDEPTNHMDIVGKETLENMLSEFTGTVIFVSHDRYFVNKIARSLLVIGNGEAEFIRSTYDEYEERKKSLSDNSDNFLSGSEKPRKTDNADNKHGKADSKNNKPGKKTFSTPLKDRSKKERRLIKLNSLINDCETKLNELSNALNSPEVYSDYLRINELENLITSVRNELDAYYAEWLEISSELEKPSK